jgi:hypothetical protein
MFYKDERLALFIDGSNLYAAAKALGFDIDYKLLRMEFMRRGKLLRAFYYTALLENDDYSPIRPLVDWLHYNGFTMRTKPAKEYTDSQGRRKVKGNMDIELRRCDGTGERASIMSCCSRATATSARWWKACSGRACASRWCRPSAASRR